eukprot:2696127-Rhodomonas_salina.2
MPYCGTRLEAERSEMRVQMEELARKLAVSQAEARELRENRLGMICASCSASKNRNLYRVTLTVQKLSVKSCWGISSHVHGLGSQPANVELGKHRRPAATVTDSQAREGGGGG